MSEISIANIDETLRALRAERAEVEKRAKVRDDEYKRATKLYIKALQKETETFERNRPNYEKRNESFREEVQGIMERFKVGAFGLLKSRDRLEKEVDRFNDDLLEHYPRLATQVKETLLQEKEDLEIRLQRIKEENQKNPVVPEFNLRVPSANLLDIKEKRQQLEKEVRSTNPNPYGYAYLKDYQDNQSYLDRYFNNQSIRQRSPLKNPGYLDDFITKQNVMEVIQPKPVISVPQIEPRRSVTPSDPVYKREVRRESKSQPRTDLLSDFMYRVPNVMYSPSKVDKKMTSPTKSESLLYSPFSAGGGLDTEPRASRPSSMKKRGYQY